MIKLTINNLTARLQGNPKIVSKVYQFLSFKHPGAFHIQKTLKYTWDGMVRPMSKAGAFEAGLLPRVLKFLAENYAEFEEGIEVTDVRVLPQGDWVVPKQVGELTLYPFQREGIQAIVSNTLYGIPWPRGFIFAGMGAGKTLMMFGTYIAFGKPKTMILLDNSTLYKQIKKDLAGVFPNEYGFMQGKNHQEGNIMVCMVKTCANRVKADSSYLDDIRMVLADEADLAGSDTYKVVLKGCREAPIRIGFSGTLFLRDLAKDRLTNRTLEGRFGEILYKISAKALEELEITPTAIIKLIPGIPKGELYPSFDEEFREVIGNNPNHYQLVLDRVKYNLLTHKKYIMVFTRFISQTDQLTEFLKANLSVRVEGVHHKSVTEEVLSDFKEGRLRVLVCSLFLKRGISFPLVRCIINASAGEFYSNPLQILGRGTRNSEGKLTFFFEDILDDGKYLSNHSKKRVIHYKREGYLIRDLRK